jgi:cytidylate kinase
VRVIAIDGPAGSGKSTLAQAVADRLGLECLDTGAMYRAVAFAVLRAGGDPCDGDFAAAVARTIDVSVDAGQVLVDGVDATVEIRAPSVDRAVSLVAANPAVRSELVVRQREWVRRRGGGVVEGRDIGTVVFPDAEVKVHLVADPAVRAQRRVDQSGPPVTGGAAGERAYDEAVESMAEDIARRDRIDSTRRASPLLKAPGAVVIDTTELTFEQAVEQVIRLL